MREILSDFGNDGGNMDTRHGKLSDSLKQHLATLPTSHEVLNTTLNIVLTDVEIENID